MHPQVSLSILNDVEGVLPTRQQRSRDSIVRFLETSEILMRKKHFNDITVEEFALAAGTSIGAFYKRFEDKNAFFRAILAIANEEYRQLVARWPLAFNDLGFDLRGCIEIIVDTVLLHCTNREGFIRSAVRRARNEADWRPHTQTGQIGIDMAICLLPHIGGAKAEERQRRLEFGFRAIYNVTIRATDDDPYPDALREPSLPANLADMIYAYWRS